MRLVYVVGTATEVGKTWMAAEVLRRLRAAGVVVAARKPAQSYEPGAGPTDAEVLAAATGEEPATVCPPDRSYPLPLAPPIAAAELDRPIPTLTDLTTALDWPASTTLGLVEGVGGVRSPIAADGDGVDLADRLSPSAIVLVADAGLGTINAVRTSLAALEPWRAMVVLNRFDADDRTHRTNLAWLRDVDRLDPALGAGDLVDRLS